MESILERGKWIPMFEWCDILKPILTSFLNGKGLIQGMGVKEMGSNLYSQFPEWTNIQGNGGE
jgi:hypothetical protein